MILNFRLPILESIGAKVRDSSFMRIFRGGNGHRDNRIERTEIEVSRADREREQCQKRGTVIQIR